MPRGLFYAWFAECLLFSGLTVLVLLAFASLSGTTLRVSENILLDSTYIAALADACVIYLAMTMCSKKANRNQSSLYEARQGFFVAWVAMLLLFVVVFFVDVYTVSMVPWERVSWFDPPLNLQLIRDYFKNNLFVSIALILTLLIIFIWRNKKLEVSTRARIERGHV